MTQARPIRGITSVSPERFEERQQFLDQVSDEDKARQANMPGPRKLQKVKRKLS